MNTLLLLAVFLSQASAAVPLQNGPVTALVRQSLSPARLTGRITGLKDLSALPITLHSPEGPPLQTSSLTDGSFEFESVPSGSYTLRAPGFTTIDLVIDGSSTNVDLKPIYTGAGVTVSGLVRDQSARLQTSTTRTVTLSPLFSGPSVNGGVSALGGSFGNSLGSALEAWVRPDGKFEFPAVPSGSYMLRTLPAAAATSKRVDIASNDIRNLEIVIPYQLETTGRVLLEGRDLGPNATVEATQPTFTMATGIHADGSFKLRLTEGENQIALTRLPVEFAVKKISFGPLDVTRHPLKVDSNTRLEEIVITLETANLDSLPGVRVSGRVIAPSGTVGFPDNHLRLSPAEGGSKAMESTANPDGTFEFRKVTPGVYWLQSSEISSRTRIRVTNKEITDVEIVVSARTHVAGRVIVVDAEGRPYPFRPDISIVFRLPNTGFGSTGVKTDGTFGMSLIDNQYMTTVANLPEGYAVKSISSGSLNLLESPLIVDAARVPDNIEVVLEYRSHTTR